MVSAVVKLTFYSPCKASAPLTTVLARIFFAFFIAMIFYCFEYLSKVSPAIGAGQAPTMPDGQIEPWARHFQGLKFSGR
jgi:hypothetical protein